MKILKKIYLITIVLLFTSFGAFAQLTDPGDGGGDPGDGDHTVIGGSAPVGSGLSVLLILGAVYGYRKVYQLKLEEV